MPIHRSRPKQNLYYAMLFVGVVLVVLMGWTINGLDAVWEQTISIIGKDMMYIDKWN